MTLSELEQTHAELKEKAENLYKSLNLPQNHPTLANIPLEYIHTLILARDLKADIQKRAMATIQEYDQIDQAAGGVHQPLGTRSHQLARKNITRRKSAFDNAIRKFNQFCAYLETHYKPQYNIPVPRTLPVNMGSLRDCDELWEDVWISNSRPPPRWLTDDKVRKGIRAVLSLERCAEERRRLSRESKNLCSWFRDELYALTVLASDSAYSEYHSLVGLRLRDHLHLASLWSTPFVAKSVFDEQIRLVRQQCQTGVDHRALSSTSDGQHMCMDSPQEAGAVGFRAQLKAMEAVAPEILPVEASEVVSEVVSDIVDESESGEDDGSEAGEESGNDSEEDGFKILSVHLAAGSASDESDGEDEDAIPFTWEEPLNRIDDSTARLDDDSVNGLANYLAITNNNTDCAMLSTYTIPALLKRGPPSESAWRTNRGSQYWAKHTWIIPIHSRRLEHWALAIVKAETREIFLFDSLGSKNFLTEWVPRIQLTVTLLVKLAQDRGQHIAIPSLLCLSDWTARPLEIRRKQSNGYDCGVWILWVIAAIMRGFDYARIEEPDISKFRKYLARSIRTLPVLT
ncbi:hypothetical protein V5O48_018580 [Marasmius crinis-equi]|uniref:Ubiquitin-like protease family profile domain-containing protein n=1 Tax=Marasmius crinis-equi TaxID=585013 RepID=A0ABR3EKX6_9AGAR